MRIGLVTFPQTTNIIWAKHNEINTVDLRKAADMEDLEDGAPLPLPDPPRCWPPLLCASPPTPRRGPQEDGVPVYNPSGRYWIKLYHMGKQVKIEIDDLFPISSLHNLFVQSENKEEIWPQIFTKALLKLNSFKWENDPNFNFDKMVGDGSIMYSLTGLIPETMKISKML